MIAAVRPHHPSPITYHALARGCIAALVLCLSLAGCGMVNWSISNASDGCPPNSTIPCP
jgi:hypothetical protein